MRFQHPRPAVGHEELPTLSAGDCDAVIGKWPRRAGRRKLKALTPATPLLPVGRARKTARLLTGYRETAARPSPPGEKVAEGRMRAAFARAASPRAKRCVIGPLRAVAAEGLDAGREINGIAAESAFGQHDGDFTRDFPSVATRAASITIPASRGGSARLAIARPSSVMRPSLSIAPIVVKSPRASLSATREGGSRKASVPGSATAPERGSRARDQRDPPREFPARRKVGGRRSQRPPKADSRRPVPCAPRARVADRRWPC